MNKIEWEVSTPAEKICIDLYDDGRGKPTIENYDRLFMCYDVTVCFNNSTMQTEIILPDGVGSTHPKYAFKVNLQQIKSLAIRCDISTSGVDRIIEAISLRNNYSPITPIIQCVEYDWLLSIINSGRIYDDTLSFTLDDPQNIPKRVFYNSYVSYCNENNVPYHMVKLDSVLGKYLKNTLKLTDGPRCNFPEVGTRLTTIRTKRLIEMRELLS